MPKSRTFVMIDDAMNTEPSVSHEALALWLCSALLPAAAQNAAAQAEKELARSVPAVSVQACSLITRAGVRTLPAAIRLSTRAAGRAGGCALGTGNLCSGPKSWETWETTLKGFNKTRTADASPRLRRASVLLLKPDNEYQGSIAFWLRSRAIHTPALSLDAEGQTSRVDAQRSNR